MTLHHYDVIVDTMYQLFIDATMEILGASENGYLMKYSNISFYALKTTHGIDVEGGWSNLAAATNTHPEVLLELIEEVIYNFNNNRR